MSQIESFRDLKVYQMLKKLHIDISGESLRFPKFEMYEIGSQVRRSSNSAAAQLAEGWGSRHTNIYLECINRSMGELRETQHHLDVTREKDYLTAQVFKEFDGSCDACGRMLERLYQALNAWRGSKRPGGSVHEERDSYVVLGEDQDWATVVKITQEVMDDHER